MISRKSTKLLAELYEHEFTNTSVQTGMKPQTKLTEFYDFLYEREYNVDFLTESERALRTQLPLVVFIKKIHTTESLNLFTINSKPEDKINLAQSLLRKLSQDIITVFEAKPKPFPPEPIFSPKSSLRGAKFLEKVNESMQKTFDLLDKFKKQLELDGYIYRDGILYYSESSVIPEEEQSILEHSVKKLPLKEKDREIILNHLKLSEEHYLNGKWGDSISNARNLLEAILKQIAKYVHTKKSLPKNPPHTAPAVRDLLEREGLIQKDEKDAVDKVYGLISNKGAHPNIANQDEARLMRHLALTFSQYMLLNFEYYVKNNP